MRAVRIVAFGEPSDVLTIDDVPTPEPGPGQVLVRMRARPINPSDLFMVRGRYGSLPRLPATAGMEGAGAVAAVGAGINQLREGQQVIPFVNGTWQEYVVAPAEAVLPLPPGLSDAQAAMLIANPASAWLLLHEVLQVQQGGWVLQNAANSAVGRHVIQLSRHYGFRTINVVRRRDVVDELTAIGADHVICETDEDVAVRVRELTDGKGVQYALDSVAGESGQRLLAALGSGGTLVVFGAMSGKPLTIDPAAMLFRGTTVKGWWLLYWLRTATQERRARLFQTIIPLVLDGTLHVPVAAEYDLADVQQAVAMAESSTRNGKVLLVG